MHAALSITLGFLLTVTALAARPPAAAPAGYHLVWQDEFDGDHLDKTKWGLAGYKKREAASINRLNCC